MESFQNELSLACSYNLLIIFGKVIKCSVCFWWCLPSAWLAAASPLTFILFFLLVFFLSLMGDDGVRSFNREGLVSPSMLDSAGWRQKVKHLETKQLSHIMDFKESIHIRFMEFLHTEKFTQKLLYPLIHMLFLQSFRPCLRTHAYCLIGHRGRTAFDFLFILRWHYRTSSLINSQKNCWKTRQKSHSR